MFESMGSTLDQLLKASPSLLSQHWSSLIWMVLAFLGLRSFSRLGTYH